MNFWNLRYLNGTYSVSSLVSKRTMPMIQLSCPRYQARYNELDIQPATSVLFPSSLTSAQTIMIWSIMLKHHYPSLEPYRYIWVELLIYQAWNRPTFVASRFRNDHIWQDHMHLLLCTWSSQRIDVTMNEMFIFNFQSLISRSMAKKPEKEMPNLYGQQG